MKVDINTDKHNNKKLYIEQIQTLKMFLEKGAITQAQYDKSSGDLAKKMKL